MTTTPEPAGDAFQVDLRGVVDLFARHLYSSPRVYLRELLQNGVDAITARRGSGAPDATDRILLRPLADAGLDVVDTGIGLTRDEAAELLATIGRSSKRDLQLGGGREEYLGQFGIGLLSAFMVADEIEVVSRSARPRPDGRAPRPIHWRGFTDGRYTLTEIADDDPALAPLGAATGSAVRLRPRRDLEHWLAPETVAALARDFGELLPIDVSLEVALDDGSTILRRLTGEELPWRRSHPTEGAREVALRAYAERTLGFTPLAHIDLDLPIAGLSGVAFVLPAAVSPTTMSRHRVYLKRMLLGTTVDDLLPPWAFFVRCVIDASALRPTASREALYEDEILLATRDALGAQIRRWVLETAAGTGTQARQFLETHHLAVRALALVDDEMLDLAVRVLPFETSLGAITPAALHEAEPDRRLLYTTTVEEFRRIAPVAAAQGLPVINGGYVYDSDLLARAAQRYPEWRLVPTTVDDVAGVLEDLEPLRELAITDAITALRAGLAAQDCDLSVRRFEPAELPAILLQDRDGEHARQAQEATDAVDDLWGEVLAGLTEPGRPRRLVLNDRNETVRALLASDDDQVRTAAARSLYVTAMLASGMPLRGPEATLMNSSLTLLLDRALDRRGPGERP